MRPDRPSIDSRADLRAHVESYRDRTGGRLGVCLGLLGDGWDSVCRLRADETFESASVIKLPVLYALLAEHDGRLGTLSTTRPVAEENRVAGSGLLHLLEGTAPTLRDLARAMIAVSDNAATNELIDYLGMATVNDAAADLGMADTRLARKMMASLGENDLEAPPDPPEPANATTPADCARFLCDLHREATLSPAAYAEMRTPLREQKYADAFPRYLPFDVGIAHKTGWVPSASLDAGILYDPDGADPLAFAVFLDGLENGSDGTDVIAEIGDAVYAWRTAGT